MNYAHPARARIALPASSRGGPQAKKSFFKTVLAALLSALHDSRLRQATRGEPSADKGKASHHKQDYDADNRQPDQGAFFDQRRKPMVSPSLDLASCPPCFTDRNDAAVSQCRGLLFRCIELAVASSRPRQARVQGSVPSIGSWMRAFASMTKNWDQRCLFWQRAAPKNFRGETMIHHLSIAIRPARRCGKALCICGGATRRAGRI